ncbi:hypothetical protein CVT25_002287 [Psilocybe cyanescens]|uniref:Uncharacterized protein n=1 Tax=Psilocybe cyanescens TaxID=93625 RepID=A0A409WKB2_PSICY|nr:hypothetical protein CVT25_002287 [Psilocybe cyanescens]
MCDSTFFQTLDYERSIPIAIQRHILTLLPRNSKNAHNATVIATRFEDTASPSSQAIRDIIAFDVLYGVGLVLLILLLFTALFSPHHIKRGPTWFMMLVGWMITSMGNLIIVGQQTGPPPKQAICLMQAMIVYASPVLMAANTSNQPMLSRRQVTWVDRIKGSQPGSKESTWSSQMFHQQMLILDGQSRYGIAGLTVLAMLAVLVMEFRIGLIMRRVWRNSDTLQILRNNELFSIETMTRLGIFCFCPMIALAVSCLQYFPGHSDLGSSLQLAIAIRESKRDSLEYNSSCKSSSLLRNTDFWQSKGAFLKIFTH